MAKIQTISGPCWGAYSSMGSLHLQMHHIEYCAAGHVKALLKPFSGITLTANITRTDKVDVLNPTFSCNYDPA